MKFLPILACCSVLILPAVGQTADEKIALLEKRVAKLEEALAKLQQATPAPAKEPAGKSTNKHGIPDAVLAKIKAKAEAAYPDDFTMQKYVIEAEVKSYKDLQKD